MRIVRLVILFSIILLQSCTILKRRYTGGFYFENSGSGISGKIDDSNSGFFVNQKKIQKEVPVTACGKSSETIVAVPGKYESGEILKAVNESETISVKKNHVKRVFNKFQPGNFYFKRSLSDDSAGNKKLYLTVLGVSLILILLGIYAMSFASTAALSVLFLVVFLVGMIFFIGSALLLLLNYWNKASEYE